MNPLSGWTWYCKIHESYGHAASENEVKHQANSHLIYIGEHAKNCDIYLKNHDEAPLLKQEHDFKVKPKSTYMEKVKESFGRAWQKWSQDEDKLLSFNFDNRMDLDELTTLHKRAEGGIVARLKKLKLVDEELSIAQVKDLLKDRHAKFVNEKAFTSPLKTASSSSSERIDRGPDSFSRFGTINPPPVQLPDLSHTSLFTCSICGKSVIGNSCLCRD